MEIINIVLLKYNILVVLNKNMIVHLTSIKKQS